ncbi:MAG: hypothetical protein LJE70_02600 [Chromatiaceae bacterium]|nr:hypothetical protein [Chromatiaceae bacterium]
MLKRLQTRSEPIRTAVIGMGAMGEGLLYQCRITPGFTPVAIADLHLDKAVRCVEQFHLPYKVAASSRDADEASRRGLVAVCESGEILVDMEEYDVLLESSNAITASGDFVLSAIDRGKHVVMMNAESDLIFGPYFMRRAREARVVYLSCDGDQHTVLKRIIDDITLWGFEVVMAGNMKGFLDRYSNPTKIKPEADKRNLEYKACVGYTDGTKLNVEMALVANGLDMQTDVVGMHGPRCNHVKDVCGLYDFPRLRALGKPVVDYILGAQPDGGVYVVGYCDHPYQQRLLKYYKMGDGPFYLFYRPYHLCHVEALEAVAAAVLDGESLLEPEAGFRTNVFAYAKHDLAAGTVLDGIGGYYCYGLIENCPEGRTDAFEPTRGVPICLAEGVRTRHPVAKDQPVRFADIELDPTRKDFDLFAKAHSVALAIVSG